MVAQGVFATGNLQSYCGVGEVLGVLSGYDLGALGEMVAVEDRIRQLLPTSRSMVDKAAGRDFLWHEDETITVDGSGSDRQRLSEGGVWPPVVVHEVRVEGRLLGAEEWRSYADTGAIRLTQNARQRRFPAGVQNVTVWVGYGEQSVPAEIALTQAKLTAAELLAELGGEGGTVQETRIGDYTVRYAEGGRFATGVKALCDAAAATLRRYRTTHVGAV